MPHIQEDISSKKVSIIDISGNTISTRFNPPKGYKRIKSENYSFAQYLRNLKLKPGGAKVKYYNGTFKPNNDIYEAVVDLPIGNRDLHQCADAIMRLRAEYLWNNKSYDQIHFNFTNGFRVDYSEWMKGKRVIVNGNQTSWSKKAAPTNNYSTFWKYMQIIFCYAGTLSLSQELTPIKLEDMQIGDIFIQGGSPGHAIIVVDMATNTSGEKIFILGQSYMPAQETQILSNPNDLENSPWYSIDFGAELITPEWQFKHSDLKRF